jgi:hypothetical protein
VEPTCLLCCYCMCIPYFTSLLLYFYVKFDGINVIFALLRITVQKKKDNTYKYSTDHISLNSLRNKLVCMGVNLGLSR